MSFAEKPLNALLFSNMVYSLAELRAATMLGARTEGRSLVTLSTATYRE
jgi:hypothetical protein